MRRLILCAFYFAAFLANASFSNAAIINLNDFFADPSVAVASDGVSAKLAEDPVVAFVLLSNDPGLGDPNVIIPGVGVTLTFAYDFIEPAPGNADEFGVFIIDAATGLSAGRTFEFFTQSSSAGSVSFDLTSLSGKTIGLQFQLAALPGDASFNSMVVVSNVQLSDGQIAVVPEPTSLMSWTALCGAGVLLTIRRSRYAPKAIVTPQGELSHVTTLSSVRPELVVSRAFR